jgi:hypothetical protein
MLVNILQGKTMIHSIKKGEPPILKEQKRDAKKEKTKTIVVPTGDIHKDFRNYVIKEKPKKLELVKKIEAIIKEEEEADMK